MINRSWREGYIFGGINLSPESVSFINEFEDEFDIELSDEEGRSISTTRMKEYSSINIKLHPPRNPNCFIAEDINEYLSYYSFSFKRAENIYLTCEREVLEEGETVGRVLGNYLSALYLFSLLENLSEHSSESQQVQTIILFYGSDKLSIPSTYNGDALELLHNKKGLIEEIAEHIGSEPHSETKKSLFKKVLNDTLQPSKEKDRFTCLIENLEKIKQQYTSNYEIFLNNFSFDNEKEKLDNQKQSYILKINEVLSGIHGKLFAVPASVIIVAGQMKTDSTPSFEIINSMIVIGAIFFSVFMWMLTANQLHSLNTIETDFTSKKRRIKSELKSSLYSEVETAFKEITFRIKFQRNMIRLVDSLVLISLLISLGMYEYYCKPIANSF